MTGKGWRYKYGAPDIHALFGWLRVQLVVPIGVESREAVDQFPFLGTHPYILSASQYGEANNSIYLGSRQSKTGKNCDMAGAGTFKKFSSRLQLTMPGRSRSKWKLPNCFHPSAGVHCLTYHTNPSRWHRIGDAILLESVGKGQEFVIDVSDRPGVQDWLEDIFGDAHR